MPTETRHIREAAGDVEEGLLRSVALDASESTFMAAVIRYAKFRGWTCYHTHDSRRSESGFPDLAMKRWFGDAEDWQVMFVELKRAGKKATRVQQGWIDALRSAGIRSYVWTPADLNLIAEVLR